MTTVFVSNHSPVTECSNGFLINRIGGVRRGYRHRVVAWHEPGDGEPPRPSSVPAGMLQFGATLLGKKAIAQRLLGSLQVDISKTCLLLDWKPPYTVQEGLKRCFERSN